MDSSTGPPDGSGCARLRLLAKPFRVFGKPQPAQGQLTPRHPLLVVDRLFRELSAFAHTLLICISGDHGACSDLCTPPLCPLADIRFNVTRRERFLRRSNAAACRQQAGAGACGKFSGACFLRGNDGGRSGHHPTGLEIERWGRQALTLVAAARRRAEAPSTSTMRSGNGGALDGPTCSPTTRMTSIASPPRSGFIGRRIRGRRARRSPTTTSPRTNAGARSPMARLLATAKRSSLSYVGCGRRAPRAQPKSANAYFPTGRIAFCPGS